MAFDNQLVIRARMVSDPELKIKEGMDDLVTFRAVYSRSKKIPGTDRYENKYETFFTVEQWGRGAARTAELAKGTPVVIHGLLKQDNWKNKDGEDRSRLVIVAEDVDLDLGKVKIDRSSQGNLSVYWGGFAYGRSSKPPVDNGVERMIAQTFTDEESAPF